MIKTAITAGIVLAATLTTPVHAYQYGFNPWGACKSATAYGTVKWCAQNTQATCPYLDRSGSFYQQHLCTGVLNQLNHDRKCGRVVRNVAKREEKTGKGPTKRQKKNLRRFCKRILP